MQWTKMDEKNELDVDLNVHILNLTVVFGWEDTSQTVIFIWCQVFSYHLEAEFSRFFHIDPFLIRQGHGYCSTEDNIF